MTEIIDYIPHRQKNASVGGHVCGADDIIDDELNRLQSDINKDVKVMGASGTDHSGGLVPDPGSTEGHNKYLREDGLWESPPDTTYNIVSKTAAGLCPQLPNETTVTKFLRQDGQWAEPGKLSSVLAGHKSGNGIDLMSNGGCAIFSVYGNASNSGGTVSIAGNNVTWLSEFNNPQSHFTITLQSNNVWHIKESLGQWFRIAGVAYS